MGMHEEECYTTLSQHLTATKFLVMLPLKDDVIIQHCHHSFLAIYESTPIMALIMTVGGSL
jgi:hypothetical protein